MAGTNYDVVVRYLSTGDIGANRVVSDAQRAAQALERFQRAQASAARERERMMRQQSEMFARTFMGGLGMAGGLMQTPFDLIVSKGVPAVAALATAFGAVVGAGIKFNEEIETARIGLAGIFQAQGIGDFQQSLGVSDSIIQKMQRDAAVLPGTFKQLLETFQVMATPGMQSGMSIKQTEEFAAKTLAVGVTSGLQTRVAAREMAAMLRGQTHSQNILASLLLPQAGVSQKEFNQMSAQKRLETLNKIFDKYGESLKSYDKSFQGIFTTTTSNLQILLGKVTKPLFEKVKGTLDEFNQWFVSHGPEIEGWATRMGDKLAHGFMKIHDAVKSAIPMLVQLYDRLAEFASNGGIEKIEKGIAIAGGMKLAGMGMSAASTLGGVVGPEAALVGLSAAALPMTVALLASAGAMMAVKDQTFFFHKEAYNAWSDIQTKGIEVLTTIQNDIIEMSYNVSNVLTVPMELLGTVTLGMSDALINAASVVDMFKISVTALADQVVPGISAILNLSSGLGQIKPNHRGISILSGTFDPNADLINKIGTVKPPNHTTHIHKVEINVRNNEDPNRIAHMITQGLKSIARNPQGGASAPRYARY